MLAIAEFNTQLCEDEIKEEVDQPLCDGAVFALCASSKKLQNN